MDLVEPRLAYRSDTTHPFLLRGYIGVFDNRKENWHPFSIANCCVLEKELGKEKAYISETLFTFIFLSFVLWTFHPFILQTKHFYTVLIWRRVLVFLCVRVSIGEAGIEAFSRCGVHCQQGNSLITGIGVDGLVKDGLLDKLKNGFNYVAPFCLINGQC
ncbi:hypothetical protein ABZP36_013791 [Zizania latifolia]